MQRLIVDGNNFLMADLPAAVAGIGEAELCRLLAKSRYAAGFASVVVVVDGARTPLRVQGSPVEAVELRFSGHGRPADDEIVELIDAHTAPRRLTVVSTDREVRAAARRRRCRSVTSEQFGHELARLVGRLRRGTPTGPPPAAKPAAELSDEEVQRWLKEFDLDNP